MRYIITYINITKEKRYRYFKHCDKLYHLLSGNYFRPLSGLPDSGYTEK